MANTTRWIIGTNWTAVTFTAADLNSLPSGGAALSTSVISNGTGLDQYVDFSFIATVGGTTLAGSYISIYLLPLNQDGSTYGDGYASSTTTQPAAGYAAGSIGVKVGVTSGSTITGIIAPPNPSAPILLPPGDCKVAFGTNLQVALNATAAVTLKWRSYNVNLNA